MINPDPVVLDEIINDLKNNGPFIFDNFEENFEKLGDEKEAEPVTGGSFAVENNDAS